MIFKKIGQTMYHLTYQTMNNKMFNKGNIRCTRQYIIQYIKQYICQTAKSDFSSPWPDVVFYQVSRPAKPNKSDFHQKRYRNHFQSLCVPVFPLSLEPKVKTPEAHLDPKVSEPQGVKSRSRLGPRPSEVVLLHVRPSIPFLQAISTLLSSSRPPSPLSRTFSVVLCCPIRDNLPKKSLFTEYADGRHLGRAEVSLAPV